MVCFWCCGYYGLVSFVGVLLILCVLLFTVYALWFDACWMNRLPLLVVYLGAVFGFLLCVVTCGGCN